MPVGEHFSSVASHYRDVRFTDCEPVAYIRWRLDAVPKIDGIELGCGTGRYTAELFEALGERLTLHCVDVTAEMLAELDRRLRSAYEEQYTITEGKVEEVTFAPNVYDAVFSFNALHHFDLACVFRNIRGWLRPGGQAFLYTRTPSQNARNLWGRCFPGFLEKEDRLKSRDTLIAAVEAAEGLHCVEARSFAYPRRAGLDAILDKVDHCHYSTFSLYREAEFEAAREEFVERLVNAYADIDNIDWVDYNLMLVLVKV